VVEMVVGELCAQGPLGTVGLTARVPFIWVTKPSVLPVKCKFPLPFNRIVGEGWRGGGLCLGRFQHKKRLAAT
jgi:hypothetical protein